MGESVSEGIVSRWLKAVGDTVDEGEPVVEVTTDKVDVEVPAPATGRLTEIVAAEGETVAVGATLAVIAPGPAAAPVVRPAPEPEAAEADEAPPPPSPAEPDGPQVASDSGPPLSLAADGDGTPPPTVTPPGPAAGAGSASCCHAPCAGTQRQRLGRRRLAPGQARRREKRHRPAWGAAVRVQGAS